MKIKYYLPRPETDYNTIMMNVSWEGKRLQLSTGLSIETKYWDSTKKKAKKSFNNAIKMNNNLELLKGNIENAYLIEKSNNKDTSKENIRKLINGILQPKSKIMENTEFFKLFRKFTEIRQDSNQFSFRTIQRYVTTFNHLQDFEKKSFWTCSFENMNSEFYLKFKKFLHEDKNLVDNSFGSVIRTLKIFLNWALENGYHNNFKFKKELKAISKTTFHVALNESELKKIEKIKLSSKRFDEVRDIFLMICYTSLRYSDINELDISNFDFKNNVIRINQEKKEELIEVPIHQKIQKLLIKYPNNNFPKLSEQKFNNYIKEVFKEAKIDDPIQIVKYYGQNTIKETVPKYELISSNTARRTFITLTLKKNVLPESVMKVIGHKSRKAFQVYVNIAKKEALESVSKVWDKL